MRPDVAKIAADVEKRRRERELVEVVPVLVDLVREGRLLAAILCDGGILEECEDVEVDDFSDVRARAAFTFVRKLQYANGSVTFRDWLYADMSAISPDAALATVSYVTLAIARWSPFLGERCLRECKERLRSLAETRRSL